ncbi:anti-sigma factor [Actinoallomurus rhizosphaericola]|uniref:hypothetical protein n=1 Tax=Actinoallomurus rhizosphaericola TaxID=2952536 RepID=UPI002092E4B9|nr:hypothetical protein [Actinoallomurus rhizosphaericola]MCO5995105.1 hypothetical protein [Actinoallomurus rhizosphaericola]
MTAAHLDYDALADLAEGILDDATATSAEQHLTECAQCRDRATEVADVSRVLAEAPTPPMPAHLVERLDAVIAAEAASHVPGHRHARRFQLLAAAAAAVVVVGGGGVIARTVLENGDSNSATVSQRPVEDPSRPRAGAPRAQPRPARSVPFTAVRSGTRYTSADLESQVASALSSATAADHALNAVAPGSLADCVGRVSGGKAPLLVDSATYDDRPATVIALPGADGGHADVWIVGAKCSADDPDLIAHRQIAR